MCPLVSTCCCGRVNFVLQLEDAKSATVTAAAGDTDPAVKDGLGLVARTDVQLVLDLDLMRTKDKARVDNKGVEESLESAQVRSILGRRPHELTPPVHIEIRALPSGHAAYHEV